MTFDNLSDKLFDLIKVAFNYEIDLSNISDESEAKDRFNKYYEKFDGYYEEYLNKIKKMKSVEAVN